MKEKKRCDHCRKIYDISEIKTHWTNLFLCTECMKEQEHGDMLEMEAEQKAQQYNEEVLAGMHEPDDYGDYMERIMMLYDDDWN